MRGATRRRRTSCGGALLAVIGVLAAVVQLCSPAEMPWLAGVVVPAVAFMRLAPLPRVAVSAALVVQALTHLACALGPSAHAVDAGWHVGIAVASVLLVHVGGRSVGSALVTRAVRWARTVDPSAVPPTEEVPTGAPVGIVAGATPSGSRRGRAPPCRGALPAAA